MTNDKVERKDEEGMERIASGENTPWTTPVLGRQFDGFAVKGDYISFADLRPRSSRFFGFVAVFKQGFGLRRTRRPRTSRTDRQFCERDLRRLPPQSAHNSSLLIPNS